MLFLSWQISIMVANGGVVVADEWKCEMRHESSRQDAGEGPTQIACVSGTVFVAANSVDPRMVLELFDGEWIPEICGEELDLS